MSDLKTSYTVRSSGLWSPRHAILDEEGNRLGTLSARRNRYGMIVSGEYRPEKGEVLFLRRDPGLLRAQFSLWTEGGEWLGSSLRWNVARRQIDMWTGSKPYRVVPSSGPGFGWRMVAARTGASARVRSGPLGRSHKIEVYRKTDFELVLFAFFLGSLSHWESFFPTALDHAGQGQGNPMASGA